MLYPTMDFRGRIREWGGERMMMMTVTCSVGSTVSVFKLSLEVFASGKIGLQTY